MEERIIPENETIIALDTCTIRDLCYSTPPWVDCFAEMKNKGYHFCFSDVLGAEIIKQYEAGAITVKQLKQCFMLSNKFVSPILPVLPGKKQLFKMSGLQFKDDTSKFDMEFEHIYSSAVWLYLSSFDGPDYFNNNAVIFRCKEQKYKIKIVPGEAFKALQEERTCWIKFIKKYDRIEKDKLSKHKQEIIQDMRNSLDSWSTGTPPLSLRADLLVEYLFSIVERRTKSVGQYNPDSKKRKNDGVDILLLYVFFLPALLCTSENEIPTAMQSLSSFQKSWIFKPDKLASAWQAGALEKPHWP